jgi:hypothetical protein
MLMKDTLFTVVVSEIMLYTMPLEKEYNWLDLYISVVRVSEDCLAVSNPVAVMSLTFAKPEILMFVVEIFPEVSNPVAVMSLTVERAEILMFVAEIFPEVSNPVTVMSLTFAKAEMLMFVAEIFPAVSTPVVERLLTVADPETLRDAVST